MEAKAICNAALTVWLNAFPSEPRIYTRTFCLCSFSENDKNSKGMNKTEWTRKGREKDRTCTEKGETGQGIVDGERGREGKS